MTPMLNIEMEILEFRSHFMFEVAPNTSILMLHIPANLIINYSSLLLIIILQWESREIKFLLNLWDLHLLGLQLKNLLNWLWKWWMESFFMAGLYLLKLLSLDLPKGMWRQHHTSSNWKRWETKFPFNLWDLHGLQRICSIGCESDGWTEWCFHGRFVFVTVAKPGPSKRHARAAPYNCTSSYMDMFSLVWSCKIGNTQLLVSWMFFGVSLIRALPLLHSFPIHL